MRRELARFFISLSIVCLQIAKIIVGKENEEDLQ